jgi:hypothetical protein
VIPDLERRLTELRFIQGIEKVEHVPYQTGDQFWVRFNQRMDLGKLGGIVKKHGYVMTKFASVPSRLPRGLGELFWDGVTHVIARRISGWSRFTSKLGFEPDGIAKLAMDLHGSNQVFIATDEEGIQLLYEYLGLKYVPPTPPAPAMKLTPPAKTTTPPVAKPSQPAAAQPAAPAKPAPSPPANLQTEPSTRTVPGAPQTAVMPKETN